MPVELIQAFGRWSSFYGDHQALSVTIRYLHLASLAVGGGAALTVDRGVIATARRRVWDSGTVAEIGRSHRLVVSAFALLVLTGALMAAADVDTYLVSTLFWIKMALIALLVVNGAILTSASRATRLTSGNRRLLLTASAVSALLWLAIVYASSWLMVAA